MADFSDSPESENIEDRRQSPPIPWSWWFTPQFGNKDWYRKAPDQSSNELSKQAGVNDIKQPYVSRMSRFAFR